MVRLRDNEGTEYYVRFLRFNSSMVRLREPLSAADTVRLTSFNSSMVRLRVAGIAYYAGGGYLFQFQYGAIER